MYADEIALISDTIVGLQRQFNLLSDYCDNFKLTVNVLKNKILVFKMVVFYKEQKSGSTKEPA